MIKSVLCVALVAACFGAAQGQLYRMAVITKWNTSVPAVVEKLASIEPQNVLPCIANMVKGVMGVGVGQDGTGATFAYYAKVYDFTSYAQYDAYRTCSNNVLVNGKYPNTDDYTLIKTRIGFKIPATAPLPAVGKWVYIASGNATKPADLNKLQTTHLTSYKCNFGPAYGAYIADAAYNANLKNPVGNAYYAEFPEGAGLSGYNGYLAGNALLRISPPTFVTSAKKLYTGAPAAQFSLGFYTTLIKK